MVGASAATEKRPSMHSVCTGVADLLHNHVRGKIGYTYSLTNTGDRRSRPFSLLCAGTHGDVCIQQSYGGTMITRPTGSAHYHC